MWLWSIQNSPFRLDNYNTYISIPRKRSRQWHCASVEFLPRRPTNLIITISSTLHSTYSSTYEACCDTVVQSTGVNSFAALHYICRHMESWLYFGRATFYARAQCTVLSKSYAIISRSEYCFFLFCRLHRITSLQWLVVCFSLVLSISRSSRGILLSLIRRCWQSYGSQWKIRST